MPSSIAASVVGSVAGGLVNKVMGDDATDAQMAAADKASETQKYMYDTTRADMQPYRDIGNSATFKLSQLMGLSDSQSNRDAIKQRLTSKYGSFFTPAQANKQTNQATGMQSMSGGVQKALPFNEVGMAQAGGSLPLFQRLSVGFENDPEVQSAIGEYMNTGGTNYQKVMEVINRKRRGY